MASDLHSTLFLKRGEEHKELAKGSVLLLVGTPTRVMAEIDALFPEGQQPNVLLSDGVSPLAASDVIFFTHEFHRQGFKYLAYERWANTLASARNWSELLESAHRELKQTLRLVVCTNLNLALGPNVLTAPHRVLRDGLRTLGLTAQTQGIPVLAGIYAEYAQLRDTVQLVRKNATRVNNIVVEELS